MIKVIDNFVDNENFIKLKHLVKTLPWFYNDYKVSLNDGNYQLTHIFYEDYKPNSDFLVDLNPITKKLNMRAVVRIKANLTFKDESIKQYEMHKDFDDCLSEQKTAIYYLNTNNGKTIFENGEEIMSKENRIVIFSGNLKHTGTTHTDTKYRALINFNYY